MTNDWLPDVKEWLAEATKRNDRTYAALVQIAKPLPGVEGDLHRLWREIEEHQQAVRKGLIRMRELLRTDERFR